MANLAGHLFRQATERPDKVALIANGRSTSYGEVCSQVRHAAGGLRDCGFSVGSRIGLMMPSRSEFIVFQHAAYALGGCVSPMNIHYRAEEIIHQARTCDLEILVIEGALLDRLPPLDDLGPQLRAVLVLDPTGPLTDARMRPAETVLAGDPIDGPVDMPPGALGLLLSTSATTGKAKGVMLSIGNVQSNYDATPGWLGLSERDVILCALPLYNTFGLNQCINAAMLTGCTLVLLPRFEVGAVLDAVEAHRATFLPAVPTMLQKILSDPATSGRNLSSIERIMVGAAPVPSVLLGRIRDAMGDDVIVIEGYGLTEATAIVTVLHVQTDADGKLLKPRSVGQALPGIEMMVADEAMLAVAPGEVGEICIRGPNVMQGYYKQPEETLAAVVDGWLRTGDLGVRDADGYYTIVDRKKDVIIRGGQNIYPADIEDVLYRHPAVAEVAVVAVFDEELGEIPIAYVAFRDGQVADPEALREMCRATLANYKVPRRIVVLAELPKGPTGKILRRSLRDGLEMAR